MNRGLVIAGAVMLAATVLIPFVVSSANDDWDGIVFTILFLFVGAPILGITGLVLLIVGLSSGRGQHQQQQVVVHVSSGGTAGAAVAGVQVRCPGCGTTNPAASAFCSQCGVSLGTAAPRKRAKKVA